MPRFDFLGDSIYRVGIFLFSGSERVAHTGATGVRLQEAGSINRSLAALSDVIKVFLLLFCSCGGEFRYVEGIPWMVMRSTRCRPLTRR